MGVPALVALAIGTGAAGTGTSVYSAVQQNQAIKRQSEATRQSAATQARQLQEQASVERQKRAREAQQVRGRLAALASDAGVGLNSGSQRALGQQSLYDEMASREIVNRNLRSQIAAVQSGAQANLESLSAQQQSPIISGVMGGLQGFQTGIQIGMGFRELTKDK